MEVLEKSTVRWGGNELTYQIKRSNRRKKTVALRILPGGTVQVLAPSTLATYRIDEIVAKRAEWIMQKLQNLSENAPPPTPEKFITGEAISYLGRQYRLRIDPTGPGKAGLEGEWLIVPVPAGPLQAGFARAALVNWFKREAAILLPERVGLWHPRVNVPMPRVIIAGQRKSWGSCSQDGTIRLNWRIMQSPMRLIDYLVVHELVHMRHPNHSRLFWQDVGQAIPDYRQRREELNRRGNDLTW